MKSKSIEQVDEAEEEQKAKRFLQEAHQKKVEACSKEIEKVLEKYKLTIRLTPSSIVLVPRESAV